MSNLKPNKRKPSEFSHYRSTKGMSEQERADFSYADLKRYFKVCLWTKSHRCWWSKCEINNGQIEEFDQATLDHVVPRSRGGHTRLSNLQLMHKQCNYEKANTMPKISKSRYYKALVPVASRREAGYKFRKVHKGE